MGGRDDENGVGWGGERKTLLCRRMPVINVEGMTELENHHFVTPNIKSDSGRIHQGMLKPLGERLFRNIKLTWCQSITPTNYLAVQRENVSLKWKDLAITTLTKSSNLVLLTIHSKIT